MQHLIDHMDIDAQPKVERREKVKQLDQDTHWLKAFQGGDVETFREVYLTNYRALYAFTISIMKGDPEVAEDIVQETFRKLWEDKHRLTDAVHIRNFLFLVARNHCYNALRYGKTRLYAHKEVASLTPAEERNAEALRIQAEVIAEIYRRIDTLPSHYARVIRMLYLEEMKPVDVAQHLGISINAVNLLKMRALKVLRLQFMNRSLLVWFFFSSFFY